MKAVHITALAIILAALITGIFTFISNDSPTMNQAVSENGKAAIHTGNGDINQ